MLTYIIYRHDIDHTVFCNILNLENTIDWAFVPLVSCLILQKTTKVLSSTANT